MQSRTMAKFLLVPAARACDNQRVQQEYVGKSGQYRVGVGGLGYGAGQEPFGAFGHLP